MVVEYVLPSEYIELSIIPLLPRSFLLGVTWIRRG